MHLLTPVENEALRSASSFFGCQVWRSVGLIAIGATLIACEQAEDRGGEQMPVDFGFEWDDGWTDHYISDPSIYTRHTANGDTSAHFQLDSARMALVWNAISNQHFLDLPSKLDCKPGVPWVIPAGTCRIAIWFKGDTLHLEDQGGCTEPTDRDAVRRFMQVSSAIDSLLHSVPAVKALSESGLLFY